MAMSDPWMNPCSENTFAGGHHLFGSGNAFSSTSGFLADVTNVVSSDVNKFDPPSPTAPSAMKCHAAEPQLVFEPAKIHSAAAFLASHGANATTTGEESPGRSKTPIDVATAVLDDDGATPQQQRASLRRFGKQRQPNLVHHTVPVPAPDSLARVRGGQGSHAGTPLLLPSSFTSGQVSLSSTTQSQRSSPTFSSSILASGFSSCDSLRSGNRSSTASTVSESGSLSDGAGGDSAMQTSLRRIHRCAVESGDTNSGNLQQTLCVVEFKMGRRLRFRCPFHITAQQGQYVVVELDCGGVDCGLVEGVFENPAAMKRACVRGVPHHEFGHVIRVATSADCCIINDTLPQREEEALAKAHQLVHFLHLPFVVVDAEMQFDMKQLKIFYSLNPQAFTSVMPNVSRLQRELTFTLKTKVVIEQLKPTKPRSLFSADQ